MEQSWIYLLGLLTTLLGLSANAFVALLFQRLKKIDEEHSEMRRELMEIRLNYLDRFDDVKQHQYKLHLETKEKISILEVLIKQDLNK